MMTGCVSSQDKTPAPNSRNDYYGEFDMDRQRSVRRFCLLIVFIGMMILCQIVPLYSLEGRNRERSSVKIDSEILDEGRTISISLPEKYEPSRQIYPVLYVLDAEGKTLFQNCVSTVSDLNTEAFVPQMIVVGIWNTNRNRDMIPVAIPHRPGSGGSEKFLDFIEDELMPYIKANYRASDYSILYGMSNSALFAVYALLEKPKTFKAFIASSPMIGHCPEYIREKAKAIVKRDDLENRFLYMIYGTEDSRRVTEYVPDFHDYMDTHAPENFIIKLEILQDEGHVPESSLARGLRYIFSR